MAIIRFGFSPSDIPADAVDVKGYHESAGWTRKDYSTNEEYTYYGPRAMWAWKTHVGLCLRQWENNGYHDSDFMMLVWNPEKGEPETICYASTRGWSYPSYGSDVDATPEAIAAWKKWSEHKERLRIVSAKWEARKIRNALAKDFGVPVSRIRRLEAVYGSLDARRIVDAYGRYNRYQNALSLSYGFSRTEKDIDRVVRLGQQALRGRLRNEFRKKLGEQLIHWLKEEEPQYPTPFSRKQLQYI